MFSRPKIFTVQVKDDMAEPCDRVVLVKEGFSFWAAVFTVFWLAANRMWREVLLYMVLACAISYASLFMQVTEATKLLIQCFVALLFGFVALDLKRMALARRGYRLTGVVAAENMLNAERRYFDRLA